MEIWRDVPHYGGWYQASNLGRVRSWKGPGNNQTGEAPRALVPRVLRQAETRGDYLFVGLCDQGTVTSTRVNRLILLTFTGEPPTERHQAAHNNGNRQDNRAENLRWATPEENCADQLVHGTRPQGSGKTASRLTEAKVKEAKALWASGEYSAIELGARYGVSGPTIWKAVTGKTWSHLSA